MSGIYKQQLSSREEFRKKYGNLSSVMPKSSQNQPLIGDGSLKGFYKAMEEGCQILIHKNPELVRAVTDEPGE